MQPSVLSGFATIQLRSLVVQRTQSWWKTACVAFHESVWLVVGVVAPIIGLAGW